MKLPPVFIFTNINPWIFFEQILHSGDWNRTLWMSSDWNWKFDTEPHFLHQHPFSSSTSWWLMLRLRVNAADAAGGSSREVLFANSASSSFFILAAVKYRDRRSLAVYFRYLLYFPISCPVSIIVDTHAKSWKLSSLPILLPKYRFCFRGPIQKYRTL